MYVNKSSIMQNIILEQIKAGKKFIFLNSEGGFLERTKWKTQEQRERIQNRWNARKLKRHLAQHNPERQTRKI